MESALSLRLFFAVFWLYLILSTTLTDVLRPQDDERRQNKTEKHE